MANLLFNNSTMNENQQTENNSEIINKLNETVSLQKSQLEQQKKSSNYTKKIVFTLVMVFFIIPVVINGCAYFLLQ